MADRADHPIFGKHLSYAIRQKGLTQRELARRLELDASNITDYCRGYRLPSRERLRDILLILDDPSLSSEVVACFEVCALPTTHPVPAHDLVERLTQLNSFYSQGILKDGLAVAKYGLYDLAEADLDVRHSFDILALDIFILTHEYGLAVDHIREACSVRDIDEQFYQFHEAYLRGRLLRCAGDYQRALAHLTHALDLVEQLRFDEAKYAWIDESVVAMVERDWCFSRVLSKQGIARSDEARQVSLLLERRANRLAKEIKGRSGGKKLRTGEIHYLDNIEALARCASIAKDKSAVADLLTEIDVRSFKHIRPREERVGMLRGWEYFASADIPRSMQEYTGVVGVCEFFGNHYHRLKADFARMRIGLN